MRANVVARHRVWVLTEIAKGGEVLQASGPQFGLAPPELLAFQDGYDAFFVPVRFLAPINSILYWRGPRGVVTSTTSPLRRPSSALPSGDSLERRLLVGSASVEPTITNSCASPPLTSL